MKAALAAALALLTGCGAAPGPVAAPSPYTLVPVASGLDVAGSGGRQISFGRDRIGATASAERVAGVAGVPVTCDGGRDGVRIGALTLVFTGKAFTGWQTAEGRAGTPCGALG